jgi:uncharacterized protein (DUF4415 family)
MKEKNIVRYTRETLPKDRTRWDKIRNMSEEEIEKAAREDPENPPWTKKMLREATLRMPEKKVSVHMYIDTDVVNWFKLSGKGYQTRINAVLKSYVHKHLHKHP